MAAGVSAYEPADAPIPSTAPPPVPTVDSRTFLDQLQQLSDAPVEQIFRDRVFDRNSLAQLDDRRDARQQYGELAQRAAAWGTPQPIRADMAAWRFGEAKAGIAAATAWLNARDELLTAVSAAGLSPPLRLEEAYRRSGGEEPADEELAAEGEVVASYGQALAMVGRSRGPLERLGQLGAEDPSILLADANRSFGEGDLFAATELIGEARSSVESAAVNGIVRIGSVIALVVGVLWLAIFLGRRRRGSDYTARP
jgi:hypothetical protein